MLECWGGTGAVSWWDQYVSRDCDACMTIEEHCLGMDSMHPSPGNEHIIWRPAESGIFRSDEVTKDERDGRKKTEKVRATRI